MKNFQLLQTELNPEAIRRHNENPPPSAFNAQTQYWYRQACSARHKVRRLEKELAAERAGHINKLEGILNRVSAI